jgi:hypothetical protein
MTNILSRDKRMKRWRLMRKSPQDISKWKLVAWKMRHFVSQRTFIELHNDASLFNIQSIPFPD